MYVLLADHHDELTRLRFQTAVQSRLAGNEEATIPDLEDERLMWDDWLMSEIPKEAKRSKDEDVVYAALFPENRRGLSTKDIERMTRHQQLKEQGLLTEVSEDGAEDSR